MTQVDVETFDVSPFLRDLCDAVLPSGDDRGASLREEAAHLEATQDYAIPMGLLVTELLANSLGHASSQAAAK
jgi:two-component sensor histidine kinase